MAELVLTTGERTIVDWESLLRRPEPSRGGLCLGSVPFLYAEPLLYGLCERDGLTVFRAMPDTLTDEFTAGGCDAVLLPVLGVLRKTRARIVPGMGVCAAGMTGSERLLCRVPPAEVRTISVNAGDGLGGDLALILLAELFSARAEVVQDASEADARVISGDAGLLPVEESAEEFDLARLWNDLTDLPLVLAVWALGDGASTAQLRALFTQALQMGLDNLENIAEEGAGTRGMDFEAATRYLTRQLHYRAGSVEMDSMRTLVALAKKHGRCPVDSALMFC